MLIILPATPQIAIQRNELLALANLRRDVLPLQVVELPLGVYDIEELGEAAIVTLGGQRQCPFGGYHAVAEARQARLLGTETNQRRVDVAHRTEHDAVRLRVEAGGLAEAVAGLRAIAARDGLAASVAIQPMLEASGEALLGIQGESELGPLVVLGILFHRIPEGGTIASIFLVDGAPCSHTR